MLDGTTPISISPPLPAKHRRHLSDKTLHTSRQRNNKEKRTRKRQTDATLLRNKTIRPSAWPRLAPIIGGGGGHRGPMSRTHRRPTPIAAVERAERSSKSRNETRTECVHLTTASRSEAVSTLHRGRLNFTFLLRLVDQRLQK